MQQSDRESTEAALVEALFTRAPAGLFVLDPELRVVRFNTAARGMRGLNERAVIGRTIDEFAPGFHSDELVEIARQVLDTGTSVRRLKVTGHPLAEPTRSMTVALSMFRLRDPDGKVLGIAVMAEDITEQETAVVRLEILNDAHRRIGSTLDPTRTAEELADVAVGDFADTAVVELLDDVFSGRRLAPGPVAAATPLRRAAHRSFRDGAPFGAPGSLATLPFPTPFSQSLHDLQPRLVAQLSENEPWLTADSEHTDRLVKNGVHSMIVAPLIVHGTVLGLAVFLRSDRVESFDEEDLRLAGELADRTALSLDRARHFIRERTVATTLQRRLLPVRPPDLPAVETAFLHLSGAADADWFDVIPLSGARTALTCGTVIGRGVETAATMGQLRTVVQTLARMDLPPDELLAGLDETVDRLTADTVPDPGDRPITASCLYLVYDPVSGLCTAASAGHPPLLALGRNGAEVAFDVPVGPPLTGSRDAGHRAVSAELPAQTLIALHTQGLIAGREEDELGGRERLRRVLAHPDRALSDLCDDVAYAVVPHRLDEDAMLLLARTRRLGPDRVALWTLPADPVVVSTARTLVARQLAAWNLDDLADSTELIISELVTNAIRYGQGPVQLRLIRDRGLLCEVSDASATAPHMRLANEGDEGGRGLFLVMTLSRRWGTRYGVRGKTVWSEQTIGD
ncbi:SpoIIE family protein phosphatase [Kitasatospora sp. NPDC059571]|uniref:SpoIIE family protein phosphatase n=1 Tax=Kitasatospora sp. NPDC059571 TaxID=3346871 RepID=UPI0036884868